jgi:hypothetical protein
MEDIFKRLIKEDLTPNQLYLLWCKRNSLKPNFNINLNIEYMRLVNAGWLDENQELVSKSIQLIQELDSFFKISKKKTSNNLLGDNFICRIEEYLEIFPKFKLPSGKYARSDKKNLETNFRWFFETHSYDWETIINATKMYVDEYERQGYKYMRTSQYFIRKLNPAEKTFESELANYCEVYLNGSDDYGHDSHFKEKVV